MPTPASERALQGLRDLSTLQWYVIPLLAIKTMRARLIAIGSLYGVAVAANVVCMGFLGWVY